MEPPQKTHGERQVFWKSSEAQPGEPINEAALPGNASSRLQRQAAEPHWIKHFLALLCPQCFSIRWSHPCPHLWQCYSALSYSMCPREGAQTLLSVKALIFTQCDTDPAQRTLLLRHAGRALISLIHSPSSPCLTQGTERMERKWFCCCFESNTSGLLLNQRIKPCPVGHWGALLPSKWTKPVNLPVFPCVT